LETAEFVTFDGHFGLDLFEESTEMSIRGNISKMLCGSANINDGLLISAFFQFKLFLFSRPLEVFFIIYFSLDSTLLAILEICNDFDFVLFDNH
jgi:hypothetical protein